MSICIYGVQMLDTINMWTMNIFPNAILKGIVWTFTMDLL